MQPAAHMGDSYDMAVIDAESIRPGLDFREGHLQKIVLHLCFQLGRAQPGCKHLIPSLVNPVCISPNWKFNGLRSAPVACVL